MTVINQNNIKSEVFQSDKPVVVILVSEATRQMFEISFDKIISEAQNTFGDQYKIVIGTAEDNREISGNIPVPLIYPPVSTVSVYDKGERLTVGFFSHPDAATQVFESIKDSLQNN